MRKYLLMVLFCVGVLFGFGGMTKAAEWTDITEGKLSGSVEAMFQAVDGKLYLGGKSYDDDGGFAVWQYYNGVVTKILSDTCYLNEDPGVKSIAQTDDGSIYVYGVGGYNTENFGRVCGKKLWRYSNGIWTDSETDLNLDFSGSPEKMISGNGNLLYFGGTLWDGGSIYYPSVWSFVYGNGFVNITNGNSLFPGGDYCLVKDVAVDSNGVLYAGGDVNGSYNVKQARVWKYLNGVWSNVTGSLTGESVNVLSSGSDGALFAGTDVNVWKLSNGVWSNIGDKVANSLLSVSTGSIYVGEYGKIYKYSNGLWTDETGNSLFDYVYSLFQVSDGTIYAGGYYNDFAVVWKHVLTDEEKREQQQNNLELGNKITLESGLNGQTISGQNLVINFKKLPTKLTKNSAYWMKWNKSSSYPNKTFLKKWKLKTNLYKYKVKKSSQKYKIKVSFKFTKKQLKKYLKKNKSATSSNLYLKYKKKGGSWQNLSSAFADAKVIKKNRKFIVKYFTKYPTKTQYFAIGVR